MGKTPKPGLVIQDEWGSIDWEKLTVEDQHGNVAEAVDLIKNNWEKPKRAIDYSAITRGICGK